jgi:methylated-DNA-[protein]-cysteine S-methyltransferase
MDQATHYYLVFETAGGFCGIAWNSVGLTRCPVADKKSGSNETHTALST